MAVASPGCRAADNNGSHAFMPPRMLDDVLRIKAWRRRQAAIDALFFKLSQTRLDVRPVRPSRVGQHFQFRLHTPTQRSPHLEQTIHRGDRSQGDDNATFHLFGEAKPAKQACGKREFETFRHESGGIDPDRAGLHGIGFFDIPAQSLGRLKSLGEVGLIRHGAHGNSRLIKTYCL